MKNIFIALLAFSSLQFVSTKVQAAASDNVDYQEVSYDDLVSELSQQNAKQSALMNRGNESHDLKIHAGIGYATSFSSFRLNDSASQKFLSGIQLSLGIDLFSQNLYSEITFKNYGVDSKGNESLSVKQLDLKLGYQDRLASGPWGYRLGAGISNRFMKYSNPTRSLNETIPALSINAGLDTYLNRALVLGLEFAGRTALTEQVYDRGSLDMTIRMDAKF